MAEVRPQEEFHDRAALERWLLACASAAVYYTLARLGLEFALLPEAASPVWPAAGFALAAVILWGPSAAAGVFVGAFLAAQRPFLAGSALAGLGAAAQALAGAALLRRDG